MQQSHSQCISVAGVKNTYEIDIEISLQRCQEQIAPKTEDEILPELTEAAPNDGVVVPKPRRSLDVERPSKPAPVQSFTPPPDFGRTKFATSAVSFTADSYNTSKFQDHDTMTVWLIRILLVFTDVAESGLVKCVYRIYIGC